MNKMERAAQKQRMAAITEACADEMARFNAAVQSGAIATLQTHCGAYAVSMVRADWYYVTPKANAGFGFTWAGCNDGTWAELLKQVGVARHPLFA